MIAATWLTADAIVLNFPVLALIRHFNNHCLLDNTGRVDWMTFRNGSQNYVERIVSRIPANQLHLGVAVTSVSTTPGSPKVTLTSSDGGTSVYDHVIMATHSDTTLSILKAGKGLTKQESSILGAFSWTENEVVVHSDTNMLPNNSDLRASWNYRKGTSPPNDKSPIDYTMTCCMNTLGCIPEDIHGPVLVTSNPRDTLRQGTVSSRHQFAHPVFDQKCAVAQREFHTIQGTRNISYAGAWLGIGFHEDGFKAGMEAVANHIPNVNLPFEIQEVNREPPVRVVSYLFDVLEYTGIRLLVGSLLCVLLFVVRLVYSAIDYLGHAEVHHKETAPFGDFFDSFTSNGLSAADSTIHGRRRSCVELFPAAANEVTAPRRPSLIPPVVL